MLLMDEPFGALDALTLHHMQELLTGIWEKHRSRCCSSLMMWRSPSIFPIVLSVMTTDRAASRPWCPSICRRPRHYDMVASPEFQRLHRTVLDAIRSESLVAPRCRRHSHELEEYLNAMPRRLPP